jgi:hypothetical protein
MTLLYWLCFLLENIRTNYPEYEFDRTESIHDSMDEPIYERIHNSIHESIYDSDQSDYFFFDDDNGIIQIL